KLLAGALVVAGMAPFLGTAGKTEGKTWLRWLPVGAVLVSLGLLSHSGVLFTVVPFAIFLLYKLSKLFRTKQLSYMPLLVAAGLALAILMPWQVYRNSITTSDRLVKYHFANVTSYADK